MLHSVPVDLTARISDALTLPPTGNTGADFTNPLQRPRPDCGVGVSVGWLTCTWVGYFSTLSEFTAWALVFVGELVPAQRRWRGYDSVYVGEHSVMCGVRERDGGVLEIHLDIPASVLESLPSPTLRALLTTVALHAQNVSRLDVTLDDWMKVITPRQLDDLTTNPDDIHTLNKDHCVTRVEQADYHRSKGPRGGDTWYLGGKGGLALLRVYDKARESLGVVDAIRWELQLRGDRAKDAVVALAMEALHADDLDAVMGDWAAAQLVRFVDFRDRSVDSNISRCPRVSWWICLVLNASKARSVVVKPPLTVERMHDYAQKALPSFLATLADSAGIVCGVSAELWLVAMLDEGRRNRSARHEMVLRSAGVRRGA